RPWTCAGRCSTNTPPCGTRPSRRPPAACRDRGPDSPAAEDRRMERDLTGGFGAVSLRERRRADRFFADLFGAGYRRAAMFEAEEDPPAITLSSAEVLVCVGGINNATVTATTTGGGTVAWSIADPTRASITASGNTATIRGRHPGVTTVRATLTSGG